VAPSGGSATVQIGGGASRILVTTGILAARAS
jgi:hypothetical protein